MSEKNLFSKQCPVKLSSYKKKICNLWKWKS